MRGLRREAQPVSATAVFEAVVNAVAHRDYLMHWSRIRLQVFGDELRLTIYPAHAPEVG